MAGYSSHPAEETMDILEFSKSSNAEFIIENGYDLSYDTLVQIVNHVKEFVTEEADSMMRFFD